MSFVDCTIILKVRILANFFIVPGVTNHRQCEQLPQPREDLHHPVQPFEESRADDADVAEFQGKVSTRRHFHGDL